MIATSRDPRIQLAHLLLGAVDIAADPALPPRVVRLVVGDGRQFIAKQHAEPDRYAGELHAYRALVTHLSGHAPELVGRDDATRTLLLTALAGDRADTFAPGSPEEELAHHEAGHVLGKLHRATAMPQGGAVGASLAERFQGWIGRAVHADLLDAAEEHLLKHHAVILGASHMDSAICHLDYQPRNWLLGDTFGIYDFEHMRRDARVRDFARLEFRRWQAAPHLRTAFFDGYGRSPNDTERRLLESFGAIEAATALVKGHQENDAAQRTRQNRPVPAHLTSPLDDTPLEIPVPQHEQPPTNASPRRAVVTGSAGFIGSHLAHALIQAGTTVIGVDRRDPSSDPTAAANLAALRGRQGYHHVTADLLHCAIEPLLIDADAVFHLAGIPGVRPSWGPQFGDYLASNVLATHRVLEASTRIGVPRLVVASSSSVYGPTDGDASRETDRPNPASPYAVTKLAEEQLCLAYAERPVGPKVVALRYFTVYGPRQRADMFTHRALYAALTGQPLRLYGDGHQRRDFTYIDDVVAATIAAGTVPNAHGTINVGGGSNASLLDVINIANSLTGREIQLHQDHVRNGDVILTRADPGRAGEVLGWQPRVDLHSGLGAHMQALAAPVPDYSRAA